MSLVLASADVREHRAEHSGIWARRDGTALFVVGLAAALAFLLVAPGETVTTRYLNELMIALDGAHRVISGQVPSRDFHTPLGPVVYYLPALGSLLAGPGQALPIGTAMAVGMVGSPMAYVFATRLHVIPAVALAAFLLLILATPLNPGEPLLLVSDARFYNRLGWAALATLLVMHVPPLQAGPRTWPNALAAAFLTLLLLYTKATYGVFALAFLFLVLLERAQRRWALLALAAVALTVGLVEVVWGATLSYAADLRLAAEVSGLVRGSPRQIVEHVNQNFADYAVLGLVAGMAAWTTRSLRDVLFYLFCAVGGFFLINQNFQTWGILSIHAAAVVAAELLTRAADRSQPGAASDGAWGRAAGAQLIVVLLVLPTLVHHGASFALRTGAAWTRAGEELATPNLRGIRLVDLQTPAEHQAGLEYLRALRDGVELLQRSAPDADRIFVLGLENPFSVALGRRPPRGDSASLRWGRTIDADHFVPPAELLQDVRVVMEPLGAAGPPGVEGAISGVRTVYGAYVAEHFDAVAESARWRVHRRKETGRACPPACPREDGSFGSTSR